MYRKFDINVTVERDEPIIKLSHLRIRIRQSQGIRVLSTGRTNDFHRRKAPMLGETT